MFLVRNNRLEGVACSEVLVTLHLLLCVCVSMQHPALDEPVAEAVCVVADTDHLCVQVVTTQHHVCEPGQIGRDVMVSNLVHTLLCCSCMRST